MTESGYVYAASAGETFDGIALAVYGDEKYAAELMQANVDHAKKLILTGGEKIVLPEIDTAVEDDTGVQIGSAPWKE